MFWQLLYFCIFTLMLNLIDEIIFRTARSGGSGGQNVNKVETMVEGSFHVANSKLLSDRQKVLILGKLANKITKDGYLQVRSQKERSQLQNKEDVIVKMHILISNALIRRKKRKPTKPTMASKLKRLKSKKNKSLIKMNRRKMSSSPDE